MELELSQIYPCPRCRMETPHYVLARRNERVGIVCSQCQIASLVQEKELASHQAWWEDELHQILSSLEQGKNKDEE